MSPPINLPDGSEVSEVILPDGAAASEVIAPDGRTVFSAIPDWVTNRFRLDEGSGSTVDDSVGSIQATLNGPTWVSNASGTGGFWIDLDGADDWWVTDQFAINQQQYTVAGWINPTSVPTAGNVVNTVSGPNSGDGRTDGGFVWQFADSSTIELSHYSGGSRNSVTTQSVSIGQWLFVGIVGDGDTGEIYVWDNNAQIGSSSGTGTREISGQENAHVRLGAQTDGSRYVEGQMDDWVFSNTTAATESQLESFYQETQR